MIAGSLKQRVALEDLCYAAQQSAEKALKALLVAKDRTFPYTRDIATLITVVVDAGVDVPERVRNSALLSRYAFATRYPGGEPPVTAEQYADAIRAAGEVLDWVVSVLPASEQT